MSVNEGTEMNMYLPSTDEKKFRNSPFPLISGIIGNSEISRIVVRDKTKNLEVQAKIVHINSEFKLYYVFLYHLQDKKYDIIAYDKNEEKLKIETIDGTK